MVGAQVAPIVTVEIGYGLAVAYRGMGWRRAVSSPQFSTRAIWPPGTEAFRTPVSVALLALTALFSPTQVALAVRAANVRDVSPALGSNVERTT